MEPVSAHPQQQPRRRARPGPLARLDRLPVWPYERKLLWVVGAGYFFAFFDIVTKAISGFVAGALILLGIRATGRSLETTTT